PTFVPQNMPAGGGILAANYIAEIAPKDGTYLTMIGQGLPMDQTLGFTPQVKADVSTFGWIGNISDSNILSYMWHTSPIKTMQDATKFEATMAGTGAGSSSSWLPALYNKVLGTKFKLINGYPGAAEVSLAMERGEIDGYGSNPWSSLLSVSPNLVRDHLVTILVQIGVRKEKALPNVPLLSDLARNAEDKAILDFISQALSVGRPVGTTPGVPPERLAALRKAFDDTLADPEFLTEAARANAEINPMDGVTLQRLIEDVMNTPQDVKDKVKAILPERT
ncbi:MAG: tripartite tricarboxylate transporter family receptor, partial [Ramlibacter sp.]|nr:tripartite tricarboxylate transporter family receptor [Ramlibacter sp.]